MFLQKLYVCVFTNNFLTNNLKHLLEISKNYKPLYKKINFLSKINVVNKLFFNFKCLFD